MRYALISDVHANLPALDAVLRDIAERTGVEATLHLGDLVGYAPWPNEVVALLRDENVVGIAGNHDSTVGLDHKHCGCRYEDPKQEELSHVSFEWTKVHSSAETKVYLAALPFRLDLRPRGAVPQGRRWYSCTARRHSTPSTGPKTGQTTFPSRCRASPGSRPAT
jgi:hypothetical protein